MRGRVTGVLVDLAAGGRQKDKQEVIRLPGLESVSS